MEIECDVKKERSFRFQMLLRFEGFFVKINKYYVALLYTKAFGYLKN